MKEFLSALAGGVFALLGSYLASRWQGKHQRSNMQHEARISLYVDLIADCQRREVWLNAICDSYRALKQLGKDSYTPAVPLAARIELFAPERTGRLWTALEGAQAGLRQAMEAAGFPTHDEDLMLPDAPEVVVLRQRIAELREAVHRDLARG